MSKRGRQSDKYPQLLTAAVEEAVAHTYIETVIPLPVPRYGATESRPFVFEILKIWVTPIAALAQAAAVVIDVQLATISLGAIDFDDPRVILRAVYQDSYITTGGLTRGSPFEYNFTTQDRGLIVGTDNLYLGLDTTGTTAVTHVHIAILYRTTTVSATEFIGIVQSQQ